MHWSLCSVVCWCFLCLWYTSLKCLILAKCLWKLRYLFFDGYETPPFTLKSDEEFLWDRVDGRGNNSFPAKLGDCEGRVPQDIVGLTSNVLREMCVMLYRLQLLQELFLPLVTHCITSHSSILTSGEGICFPTFPSLVWWGDSIPCVVSKLSFKSGRVSSESLLDDADVTECDGNLSNFFEVTNDWLPWWEWSGSCWATAPQSCTSQAEIKVERTFIYKCIIDFGPCYIILWNKKYYLSLIISNTHSIFLYIPSITGKTNKGVPETAEKKREHPNTEYNIRWLGREQEISWHRD